MKPLTEIMADGATVSHAEHCETYVYYIAEYERRIDVLKTLIAQHERQAQEEKTDGNE